ncbi:MAG TPA: YicC/YloC family endoribonuclease [Bacteroidota bacterium]|nr:YicC/YloC family endoribonuclease [Bacteroidota bacterium]
MTGYGRGEVSKNRTTVVAEIRTVNSRYLEVATRMPASLSVRENDIKEIVRKKLQRGKINVTISLTRPNDDDMPLRVNEAAVKAYLRLLTGLRKSAKLTGEVTLDHLLKFPEVLEADGSGEIGEAQWSLTQKALGRALDDTVRMRAKEGAELKKDLLARLRFIGKKIDGIGKRSSTRVPAEKDRLRARLAELLEDRSVIDANRLELELAIYADRLDMTEEVVRFNSHLTFFMETMDSGESPGRKLNFLVQEMNREVNTMGSKANDAAIAQDVVVVKEELEKIREQLQNIE